VPGVGTVVSGTMMSGVIKLNQTLQIGPDEFGLFQPTTIKGIHTNRLPVKFARAGQSASFALKKVKREKVRKGMVIAEAILNPHGCWEFDADVLIITHSTTIMKNYEAVIHCGCTRQTAKIIDIKDSDVLRSNHRATVRFRYKQCPEYIHIGERLIFREGKTKGIGRVAAIHTLEQTEKKVDSAPVATSVNVVINNSSSPDVPVPKGITPSVAKPAKPPAAKTLSAKNPTAKPPAAKTPKAAPQPKASAKGKK